MAASNFHRNHDQHISISEKLSEELKGTGQDLFTLIDNLNQETSDEIITIVINRTVGGIYGIITDLQEIVIKSNTEEENNADLKDTVKKLSQYCNEVVQEYNSDSYTLKQKFKIFIQNILLEAEDLLHIIKKDDLHNFKHELVENLKEMMYTIQTSQFRIQVENYSQLELDNLVKTTQKEYFEDCSILENCSLEVLKTVAVNIKYNAKHIFQMAYYLNKVASNFHDVKIQDKILEAAYLLNRANADLLLINNEITDTKETVALLTKSSVDGWNAVTGLFEFIEICLENNKNSQNLKNIAKFIASYGGVINCHLGRSVKNDSLFAL